MRIIYVGNKDYSCGEVMLRFYYNQMGQEYIKNHLEKKFCYEVLYMEKKLVEDSHVLNRVKDESGQFYSATTSNIVSCLENLILKLGDLPITLIVSNEVESDNWADSDIQEASILHHKCLCVIDAFDKVNDLSLS